MTGCEGMEKEGAYEARKGWLVLVIGRAGMETTLELGWSMSCSYLSNAIYPRVCGVFVH